jgi:formylglycine-generating enzyme required for sulfatase activity
VPGSIPPSPGIYAASVAGTLPSACTSWLQAVQICAASGKRLLTNEEWQRAAAGTPDLGAVDDHFLTCATASTNPVGTGTRLSCTSSWGAADMIGNVWEWAGDWTTNADDCTNWPAALGSDISCVGGPGSAFSNMPGVARRGGSFATGTNGGVFAVNANNEPHEQRADTSFRCGR